ncbi:hypothetical protein [Streptomyces rhizosphaericus]|uniref:DUF4097 domain-containing protein n=1 Tax=Streptomyces rhizosphaericus TaxID=114699 RepID=A0A6G4ADH7_9ACTN|nr:hypothetical protein [Streptomyces rhizosphaericus]NEW71466.1 DUF4097 domain-containing protein [Streptomyces rhizosphaericus]
MKPTRQWLEVKNLTADERTLLTNITFGGAWQIQKSKTKKQENLRVRAQVIHQLITGRGSFYNAEENGWTSPRLVAIRNAEIIGILDLESVRLHCPLLIEDCTFSSGISLRESQSRTIRIHRCSLEYVNANQLQAHGDFELHNVAIRDSLLLHEATISGNVSIEGEFEKSTHSSSIDCTRMEVNGDAQIIPKSSEQVKLTGANIRGALSVYGGYRGPEAFEAPNLEVGLDALFGYGLESRNEIKDLTIRGRLSLTGAHIHGDLDMAGKFYAEDFPGYSAIFAENIRVDGDFLGSCQTQGRLRLTGARVGSNVILSGSYDASPREDFAIWADRIRVDQNFSAGLDSERKVVTFDTEGRASLLGCWIGGDMRLSGQLTSGDDSESVALDVRNSQIEQDMELYFSADGDVMMNGVQIVGNLVLRGECGDITAERLRVGHTFFCRPKKLDHLNLAFSELRVWVIRNPEAETLRASQTVLRGCTYEAMPYLSEAGVEEWIKWLDKDPAPGFSTQPFSQLAGVYRAYGHDPEARTVLISGEVRRRKQQSWLHRAWGRVLWVTAGYGYRPLLMVAWLALIVLIGTSVTAALPRSDFIINGRIASPFNPFLYTIGSVLPIVDLGESKIVPHGAAQWVSAILVTLGWVLATAVIAAVTNILRRGD